MVAAARRRANGLVLSLVAAVSELHGAVLHLESATPGLRAVLRFPPDGDTPTPFGQS